MPTPILARRLIALAAFLLATIPLPSLAQEETPEQSSLDTPNFLESWGEAPDAPSAAVPSEGANAVVDFPAAVPPRSEVPPISVQVPVDEEVDNGNAAEVRDSEKTSPALRQMGIDQYPKNPRCYAAGRYIVAPPLCPI